MKGEAKATYEAIRQDLIRVHAHWQIFKQLYAASEARLGILGDTAPGFFKLLQDVLVDSAVLSLSRLTDPASYVSFASLVKQLKTQLPNSFYGELKEDLVALQAACADIRQHRHKRVAHRVRKGERPELQESPRKLPPLTRSKIEGAMTAMAGLMNKVLGNFDSTEQLFEPIVAGDAESLLFYLEKGLRASMINESL